MLTVGRNTNEVLVLALSLVASCHGLPVGGLSSGGERRLPTLCNVSPG